MLPSQLFDGITIVVSPLLALMRDQVESLRKQGIRAARVDSSMSFEEIRESITSILNGNSKIVFVSPERFNNEKFKQVLSRVKVSMFVVDEAHCISDWGHAFRPDYLRLSTFANVFQAPIKIALTATATSRVASDILEKLSISEENVVRLPSARKNLQLSVKPFNWPNDKYEDRLNYLVSLLQSQYEIDVDKDGGDGVVGTSPPGSGAVIVYVSRQKLSERLAANLVAEVIFSGCVTLMKQIFML